MQILIFLEENGYLGSRLLAYFTNDLIGMLLKQNLKIIGEGEEGVMRLTRNRGPVRFLQSQQRFSPLRRTFHHPLPVDPESGEHIHPFQREPTEIERLSQIDSAH